MSVPALPIDLQKMSSVSDDDDEPSVFHVMFQMQEPTRQPWGDAFRGRYTLPAILEILAGFEKNGVKLRVFFLADFISDKDQKAIEAAFGSIGRNDRSGWLPVFPVCPMMYAAASMLNRSVNAFLKASHFTPSPDQIVNGNISAFGYAVMTGWRPDIAVQLVVGLPSAQSFQAAIDTVRAHREQHPDDPDLHQHACRDAVITVLEEALAMLPPSNKAAPSPKMD